MRLPNGQFANGGTHNLKHGKSQSSVYWIHRAMLDRCGNPKNAAYPDYGGRGIVVCERWNRFEHFYADMGDPPEGLSLERLDNSKGYCPENCKWATREEQARNRRNIKPVTANGKTQTLTEWAAETGIAIGTLWNRQRLGWSDNEIVNSPVRISGAEQGVRWSRRSEQSKQELAA